MENHQQPFFAHHHHDQHNANVVNGVVPLVSSENSLGLRLGTQHNPDNGILLPVVVDAEEIPENSQSQYDPNADDVAPNSPPIAAESFHADSPADMVNFIDQIMVRGPPPAFSFTDGSGFQADSYPSNGDTPPLFMPPEPNISTFMNNMPPNGNYHGLIDNQTQTAPLYNAATSSNGMNSAGLSASLISSNYFFSVNDMMQQSSMFSSNPQTNWQGSASGINQFGQYSVSPAALFSPQAYNFFQPVASTALIRPQQPSPGNHFTNVSPINPHGTSSLPLMSHFNSLNTSPEMPETALPAGSIAFNTMNTSPVISGSYSYSLPVSASNSRPAASFGNPGRGATFGPRIELGYHTFISSAPQSSPSGSSSTGGSTARHTTPCPNFTLNLTMHGSASRDINNQNLRASSAAPAGREITRQDSSGTHASSATSQQGSSSSSRQENYRQLLSSDEPIFNRVYDPRYAELGLPVDPYLRMFNQHPEFWKKVHGNGDLSKK